MATFIPSELLRKKRRGQEHTLEEIRFLIQGYVENRIPDYQMSAWLMAICTCGMTDLEMAWLTQEMRDSGEVLDLSRFGITVDKHSTGGLGDKTSLLLAPIVAAAGIVVPMMSGRALGHTGGTLDKLESIAGFEVRLDKAAIEKQLSKVGAVLIGQTPEMCPADRKLYALRDVTGTVDSLPLICSSIMSKKLAEGASALVLDVKHGSGAFMKTQAEGEKLAQTLTEIGRHSGKKVVSVLTRMDEPLGRFVGNALEVREILDILDGKNGPTAPGKDYKDTIDLTLLLAAHMLVLGGKAATEEEGEKLARKILADGSAKRKFLEICEAQGGRLQEGLPRASYHEVVAAEADGFLLFTDLQELGFANIHLGAGRKMTSDRLDPAVGVEVLCAWGQPLRAGDPVYIVHYNDTQRLPAALQSLKNSFKIVPTAPPPAPRITKVFT